MIKDSIFKWRNRLFHDIKNSSDKTNAHVDVVGRQAQFGGHLSTNDIPIGSSPSGGTVSVPVMNCISLEKLNPWTSSV